MDGWNCLVLMAGPKLSLPFSTAFIIDWWVVFSFEKKFIEKSFPILCLCQPKHPWKQFPDHPQRKMLFVYAQGMAIVYVNIKSNVKWKINSGPFFVKHTSLFARARDSKMSVYIFLREGRNGGRQRKVKKRGALVDGGSIHTIGYL